MKRSKRIWVLLGVLALICAATLLLTRYEEKQEQIRVSNQVFLEIAEEDVTALSWVYSGGGSLAFTREENGWVYDEDENFPVDQDKISQILAHFQQYSAAFQIEDVEDYSQYGLDAPECTFYLTVSGEEMEIRLGDFSKMDSQRYLDIGDGSVYLVEDDPMDFVDASLSSMIQHDDTPGFGTVRSISFAGSQNYTITRQEDSSATYAPEDDIYFVEQNGVTVPLNTASIRKYLNTITALDLTDYVTYFATDEELESFGLDDPALTVSVEYTWTDEDGNDISDTCVIHIAENPEERAAADAAIEAGETAPTVTKYVRVGDSQIVYTLDSNDYAILTAASYDDLRHKTLFWGDFDIVQMLEITLEDQPHTLTKEPADADDESSELVWMYDGKEVELDEVQAALENLTADSFVQETPGNRLELSVTLYLDCESIPSVDIQLYRYDGSYCLAVVDGKPTCLLTRSTVMDLVEAVQAIVLA